eukprot:jgi/Galph1/3002/GphlegSOOS_G1679.1
MAPQVSRTLQLMVRNNPYLPYLLINLEAANEGEFSDSVDKTQVDNSSQMICTGLCSNRSVLSVYRWGRSLEERMLVQGFNSSSPLLGNVFSEQSKDSVAYIVSELRRLVAYVSSKPILLGGSGSFIRDYIRTLITFSGAFAPKENSLSDWQSVPRLQIGMLVDGEHRPVCPHCAEYLNTSTFNIIPDEILKQVLSFLDAPDLARARQVCRKWCTFASDDMLWKEFCLRKCRSLEFDTSTWKLFQELDLRPGNPKCWQRLYPFLHARKSVRCRLQKTGRFICYLIAHQFGGSPLGPFDLPNTLIVERRFSVSNLENFILQESAKIYFEPETEVDEDGYHAFIDYLIQRNRAGLAIEGDRRIIFIPPCDYTRNTFGYDGAGMVGIVQRSYPPLS